MNDKIRTNRKIKITADSTCDLTPDILRKLDIKTIPLHVIYGDKSYDDGIDITPKDIMDRYAQTKELPKTAAVSTWEYIELFETYVRNGYDVIHLNIGSAISSSHNNCLTAARELGHVYPVDTQNLSAGTGILGYRVRELIDDTAMSAANIADEIRCLVPNVHMSFVLDNLTFLREGGRCSAIAAFGANLLGLKPCVVVDNTNGASMSVGKKYRGKLKKVLDEYVKDTLAQYDNIDTERIFIVRTDVPEDITSGVYDTINNLGIFKEIHTAHAGSTITGHCGAGTLGIVFMTR